MAHTYIQNQENHHLSNTFKQEYIEFLKRFDVSYNPKYAFDPVDEHT